MKKNKNQKHKRMKKKKHFVVQYFTVLTPFYIQYGDSCGWLVDGGGICCVNNNLNLSIKTKTVTARADATVYVWRLFTNICLVNWTHMYRYICSNSDRLRF